MPDEAEAYGLLALMELQASRLPARTGPDGEPVLLLDQDRGRWDRLLIRHGLAALDRAERLGAPAPTRCRPPSPHVMPGPTLQTDTDWARIVNLYTVLAHVSPSPVVELNRAVAVGMAYGPEQALGIVDGLRAERVLAAYPHLPAVRGDLLAKLGRDEEARAEFARAATLTRNASERRMFRRRAGAAPSGAAPSDAQPDTAPAGRVAD